MSRLFLATEQSLNRRVVIKLLPPEYASEVSAARFQREVTLTAQLQHPHILPIFAAASKGALLYYVTPYVEGESLRQRLVRAGRLSVAGAVQILREIADALAAGPGAIWYVLASVGVFVFLMGSALVLKLAVSPPEKPESLTERIYRGNELAVVIAIDTGGIKAGTTVHGKYSHTSGQQNWTFTGPNRTFGGEITRIFGCGGSPGVTQAPCRDPRNHTLQVWGVDFTFDDDGQLWLRGSPAGTVIAR